MSPTHSSRISSWSASYGHFTRYPTASSPSTQAAIPSIMYTELVNYFDVANNQLYDLLDSDTELHHIIYGIEILQASNQTLRELQHRQEQYMHDQFEVALQSGLYGWLSPMVIQQRRTASQSTPPHEMDRSNSRDNRPVQSLDEDGHEDCSCPWSLLEWMSSPNIYAVFITPTPSSSNQLFSCDICTSLQRTFIDHNTPNCPQFICFVCETTQPDHFPKDCPNHPTLFLALSFLFLSCQIVDSAWGLGHITEKYAWKSSLFVFSVYFWTITAVAIKKKLCPESEQLSQAL